MISRNRLDTRLKRGLSMVVVALVLAATEGAPVSAAPHPPFKSGVGQPAQQLTDALMVNVDFSVSTARFNGRVVLPLDRQNEWMVVNESKDHRLLVRGKLESSDVVKIETRLEPITGAPATQAFSFLTQLGQEATMEERLGTESSQTPTAVVKVRAVRIRYAL